MALNGGQDGLVLLASVERTAESCSAAQRGCFRILSDLQLHGIDELGFIHSTRADTVLLSRGADEHRLMHAVAESALQARSGSRSIVSRLPCTIQQPGPAVKAQKGREMQLTAELGPLLPAISGAFHRLPLRQDRQNGGS
jgi:hypothetical protein